MSIGTDPELFIVERDTDRPVPAHKFFPNDKHKPMQLENTYATRAFHDGFAVEINVPHGHCRGTLNNQLNAAVAAIQRIIGPKYKVVSKSTVEITVDMLKGAPDDVLQFGCDPSANVYGAAPIPEDFNAAKHRFRYAGGHMHFSNPDLSTVFFLASKKVAQTQDEEENRQATIKRVVKGWDVFVGVPLTYIFQSKSVFARRKMYGRAGEYRIQPHGLEYRTPGPEWMRNQAITALAFGVGRVVGAGNKALLNFAEGVPDDAVQAAINTGKGLDALALSLPDVGWLMSAKILQATRAAYKKEKWGLENNRKKRAEKGTIEGHDSWSEFVTRDLGLTLPRG